MRILIIHTAFIGDIVLSTPLIKKIKDTYPDSDITYVTTPSGEAILKNNPHLNNIIVYDKRGEHKGISGVWQLGKRLRYENFNMVITPHRYLRSSILSWLSRSPIRKGYDIASGSCLFTEKIKYDRTKHEVEKLLSFVAPENKKRYEIELYPGEKEKMKGDNLWKENLLEDKKVVVLAPGSKWFTKQWPVEYFNKLAESLKKLSNARLIVVGGKDEINLPIEKENTIDMRGKTSLLELADILSRADVVVTNDSSPIHIASAFKKPRIFALFGPTIEKFGFFPWSLNSKVFQVDGLKCRPCGIHGGKSCPEKHFKCMRDILPEEVFNEIKEYLGE
ncbi:MULTISPECIES: lipopolysaccharide heptosyltransferase II [Fusobacterium]|uniref:lipopolysaccharide heptosyltransferase II n=1 Tax=Fusobacterium TaxID=848 RepID=UPI001F42D35A|nr:MULTISPECIES: lipopolysaccharide heptosyltransferase II [Fusobacterium]MCF2612519.1 lipopolysaccharide heptosyltransferase II [Fusobacterium perfoetens]MDY2980491.1 lipopolysaccharide heptosyltransferase II [Fusobacterium sp.]